VSEQPPIPPLLDKAARAIGYFAIFVFILGFLVVMMVGSLSILDRTIRGEPDCRVEKLDVRK
jgi:hypothetical protein